MLKNSPFLLGKGSFVDASNNSSFSAGTKCQLNGLSLFTCTEKATEKTQIPAGQGCGRYKSGAVTGHICILVIWWTYFLWFLREGDKSSKETSSFLSTAHVQAE